jgi:uncharacterized protein (TIGR03086 family)
MGTQTPDVEQLPGVYDAALELFGRQVRRIRSRQWRLPTPCTLWTVRELVNHVTVEELWVPVLLSGTPVGAMGRLLEGDQLGDDPVLAWKRAAAEAEAAVHEEGALHGTVALWDGPAPAAYLCSQLAMDAIVHSWDLARAVGSDEHLPPPLVAFAEREVTGYAERLAWTGLFAPPVPVAPDADAQTQLLALTGRRA